MDSGRYSFELIVDDDVGYVHRHLTHFAGGQIFIESERPSKAGDIITFTLRTKGGDTLLSGSGTVTKMIVQSGGSGLPGMVVRVDSADEEGYRWLRETFYAAQERELFGDEEEEPAPAPEATGPRLKILDEDELPQSAAVDFIEPLRRGSGGPIVGIDLGTTNSCVSAWDEDRVRIIPNPAGQFTIPSLVAIEGDEVIVGHAAQKRLVSRPENTIYGSKRLLGRKFTSEVREQLQRDFQYKLVEGETMDIAVEIDNRRLDLRTISAMILTELRGYAEAFLEQPVLRAVITVPAYFNENQRFAVREAGIMAGLVVERILNEPTAAALAYGYDKAQEKTILVYDLGGGTFDVSLLNVDDNVFRVLATGGDTFLGGIDFDQEMVDLLLEDFFEEVGEEVEVGPAEMQRLLMAAQQAKHTLSTQNAAEIILPHFLKVGGQYQTLQNNMTRDRFEQATAYLVERTMETSRSVLANQRMTAEDVDVVLLVGGQTRMPMVHKKIEETLGIAPSRNINPDEAVGLGAGIYANLDAEPDKVTLQDVLPISIGVGLPGGRFQPVIYSNTPIPTSRTIPLSTVRDNQDSIEFDVFQGEADKIAENEYLGTFEIDNIPPGDRGEHSFGVDFQLNAECLLKITAWNYGSGQIYEKTLTTPQTPENIVNRLEMVKAGMNAFNIVSAKIVQTEPKGFWARVGKWFKGFFGSED